MIRLLFACLSLAAVAFAPGAAHAHPHVWSVAWTDAVFDADGRIVALNVEWQFDEFYSVVAVEGLDTNGDGRYDAAELRPLAQENVTSLAEYNFLIEFMAGGEQLAFGTVTEFGSRFDKSLLTLHMQIPLAEPVDPAQRWVTYKMYDPEFYIAIDYNDPQAATMMGDVPAGCSIAIKPPSENAENAPSAEAFYESFIEAGNLGSLYAETVQVDCGATPPAT